MHGDILKIVTAYSHHEITSVAHEELNPNRALTDLVGLLKPGLNKAEFPGGSLKVVEDGCIIVHISDRFDPVDGWDYEFRGTKWELEPLHQAVAGYQQIVERATTKAVSEALTAWAAIPTPEPGVPSPSLSDIEH